MSNSCDSCNSWLKAFAVVFVPAAEELHFVAGLIEED